MPREDIRGDVLTLRVLYYDWKFYDTCLRLHLLVKPIGCILKNVTFWLVAMILIIVLVLKLTSYYYHYYHHYYHFHIHYHFITMIFMILIMIVLSSLWLLLLILSSFILTVIIPTIFNILTWLFDYGFIIFYFFNLCLTMSREDLRGNLLTLWVINYDWQFSDSCLCLHLLVKSDWLHA